MSAIHDLINQIDDPRLRNLDRKPWSLDIPYETGGAVRPMFPDLIVVRKVGAGMTADILEPHDPSLFGRIELIRKQSSAAGDHFVRLNINQTATIKKLLLITSNPQLDELFAAVAK